MIDNYNSYSEHRANSIIKSVVVICELLRRLECKFTVAKFGDPKDEDLLLKSFDNPMNLKCGEAIIESLTTSSLKSRYNIAVNCLQTVARKFGHNQESVIISIILT